MEQIYKRPLVIMSMCYAAGVALGGFICIKASILLTMALATFLVGAAGYTLAWQKNCRVILIIFLLLGLAFSRLALESAGKQLAGFAGQRVELTGRVIAEPDLRVDKIFYILQAEEIAREGVSNKVGGKVRVQVLEPSLLYGYGDVLRITGLLTLPDPPGNPGAFNYLTYLERQGIGALLTARRQADVQKVGSGWSNPLYNAALEAKQKLSGAATTGLNTSQAAILNGLVFGLQGPIDRDTRQAFTETGVIHILSVSGLHVGLVLGGIIILLRLFNVPPHLFAPLATGLLVFYALMAGMKPSVIRATFMAALLLWGHHLGRDRDWPTTLALAALVMLLWNPLLLYHPGFQLSFAATWGILYLTPVLSDTLIKIVGNGVMSSGLTRITAQSLAVPLAAQLSTLPLVLWYYNLVSFISIPANILAVPLVGMIMLLGFASAILGLIWLPLASLLSVTTGAFIDIFLALVHFLKDIPGAVYYLASPPEYLAVAWYASLVIMAGYLSGRMRINLDKIKCWSAAGVLLGLVLLVFWWPGSGKNELQVHFLDVGQGDCILVRTPGGKNMLIDTGGWRGEYQTGRGAGDQVVAPYLRKAGVRQLDVLVLTHPHEDHAGGASYLVDNFKVGLAVVSPAGMFSRETEGLRISSAREEVPAAYLSLIDKIISKGIQVEGVTEGDLIRLDRGVLVEVLSPPNEEVVENAGLNDSSVVLRLEYGQHSFVFTGDIELEAQGWLVKSKANLASDVFKVPHHGSRKLIPEFAAMANPVVAVISVGSNNAFGHPASETIKLFNQVGVPVFRTDLNGAVIFHSDGRSLEVRTGRGNGNRVKVTGYYHRGLGIAAA